MEWIGWLVDGQGGREEVFQKAFVAALEARDIPKCTIRTGTVNMWWRKDSRHIDVSSSLDGNVMGTIHVQEYGRSLWIGLAIDSSVLGNYYKRMAASAFVQTVQRCIDETILTLVEASAVHNVADVGKKFGFTAEK
jgi:hypothetical protein